MLQGSLRFVSRVCPQSWRLLTVAYLLLNLGERIIPSKVDVDENAHPNEKWFFVNGITIGTYWRQASIDKLSMLFGRRVYGIANKTYFPEVQQGLTKDTGLFSTLLNVLFSVIWVIKRRISVSRT